MRYWDAKPVITYDYDVASDSPAPEYTAGGWEWSAYRRFETNIPYDDMIKFTSANEKYQNMDDLKVEECARLCEHSQGGLGAGKANGRLHRL